MYGVWLEGDLRGAREVSQVEGVWPELEEVELVGVVGEIQKVEDFLGGLKSLRRRKLALITLVRIYSFSTGQLSLQLELPSSSFQLCPRHFPPALSPTSLSLPSYSTLFDLRSTTRPETSVDDPTSSLFFFLHSRDGTSAIDLRLRPPLEEVTPKFVEDELAKAFTLFTPKPKTLSLELSTDGKVSSFHLGRVEIERGMSRSARSSFLY